MSFDHPEEIPEDRESYEAWEATQSDPILEQLREMREHLISLTPRTNAYGEVAIGMAHELLDLVEAIVEMPEKEWTHKYEQSIFDDGFNAHRAEVLAMVAEGLGKNA